MPRWSRSGIPAPLRNTTIDLPNASSQFRSVISSPAGVNQAMSGCSALCRIGLPAKNRRRRNTGCRLRNSVSAAVKSMSSLLSLASDQSTQASSVSWQ